MKKDKDENKEKSKMNISIVNGQVRMDVDPKEVENLSQYHIMLGTPMYGSMCNMQYMVSVLQLQALCQRFKINLTTQFLGKESLITRARNQVVDAFRRSDCTHLLFIDSDIQFDAQSVLMMLYAQHIDSNKKIICGPYPKKHICWEKIQEASQKGLGDENPNNLANFAGEFVFNFDPDFVKNKKETNFLDFVEVLESGTGFMMIEKSVFDAFEKAYPEQMYKPDHFRDKNLDGRYSQILACFDTVICPETKRYLSEDYMFCQWVRKIGYKIYLMPWAETVHHGPYEFGGSVLNLIANNINPLLDLSKIKN